MERNKPVTSPQRKPSVGQSIAHAKKVFKRESSKHTQSSRTEKTNQEERKSVNRVSKYGG